MYDQIRKVGNLSHPGHSHVRTASDMFTLPSPYTAAGGSVATEHHCLGQEPMWDSWKDLLRRNLAERFTEALLKAGLQ